MFSDHGHLIFPILNSWVGFALLGTYALIAYTLTNKFASGYTDGKESFLLARRELNTWQERYVYFSCMVMGPWVIHISTASLC